MKPQYLNDKIKPAWMPYHAADVHLDLLRAPGAPKPEPVRKPVRNMKLEVADAAIRHCKWCGIWTTNPLCRSCEHGYPTIDDIGDAA